MSSKRYRAAVQQEPRPRASAPTASLSRHNSIQREQELCLDAIESGNYDTMTDKQWVELCERTAREEKGLVDGEEIEVDDEVEFV